MRSNLHESESEVTAVGKQERLETRPREDGGAQPTFQLVPVQEAEQEKLTFRELEKAKTGMRTRTGSQKRTFQERGADPPSAPSVHFQVLWGGTLDLRSRRAFDY